MIVLKVEEYCHNCPDFKPRKEFECVNYSDGIPVTFGDTLVMCKHADRCENIYERMKMKGESEINENQQR